MGPETLELLRSALAGRYRVDRQIGRGGMATVFLAQDERHHRRVAVKLLHPELIRALGVERFGREITIAARLSHPHILPLLDSGAVDLRPGEVASPFYVMPLVEGETLRSRLERTPVVPLHEALRITAEVADALDYAHRQGVVHRDIKPENILFSEGHAVVADFGLARALDEAGAATLTQAGQTLGTPQYMSPEQITGEGEIDGRSDQYALACVLYEMLSGKPPGDSSNIRSMLMRRLSSAPPKIRDSAPGVPEFVEAALFRALSVERADRFATAGEFATALSGGSSPIITPMPMLAPRRKSKAGLIATGMLLLAAVIFATTKLARPGRADAITSVAVAPELSDTATVYLSEGILDAVANLLRRIPQLRVTAPSLVAQVRRQNPNLNAEQLGEALKVEAVLTWSLRRTADSVVLNAELLRVPGGDLVWSARYGRPSEDVSAMQGQIAQLVADSLRLQVTGAEYSSLGRRPTASAAAYDLYLRGRRLQSRGIPLGGRDAEVLLDSAAHYARRAAAQDSSFAQAYGLLSSYYFVKAFRGWGDFSVYMDSANRSLQQAFAVDSTLGDPWINMISAAIYFDDDWDQAISLIRRALRLSGFDAHVLQFGGIVVGEVEGRIDSAIVLARKSVEVEPSNAGFNTLADLFMRAGRYDSAVVAAERSLALDPTVPGPRRRLIMSLEHLRRFPEAIAARKGGIDSLFGGQAFEKGFSERGAAGYESVRQADLRRQIAVLEAPLNPPHQIPRDTVPVLREEKLIQLYAQLGEWTKAMDWVLELHRHRPNRLRLVVTNPLLAGLRADPRYLPLVRQEKLEELLKQ